MQGLLIKRIVGALIKKAGLNIPTFVVLALTSILIFFFSGSSDATQFLRTAICEQSSV